MSVDESSKLKANVEGKRLADAAIRQCQGETIQHVAIMAYAQAMQALASAQAIITLLKHKNIISENEIEGALAHSYATYSSRMETRQGSGLIIPPPPTVRGN